MSEHIVVLHVLDDPQDATNNLLNRIARVQNRYQVAKGAALQTENRIRDLRAQQLGELQELAEAKKCLTEVINEAARTLNKVERK